MSAADRWALLVQESSVRELLSRGSPLKPAVFRLETADGACIVKDVRSAPAWSRWLARYLLKRERRVLNKIAGVEGVPQILADLQPDVLVMDLLPGKPLRAEAFEQDPRGLANCLRLRIEAIHRRGVFHLDLRQRENVLVAGPATAYLVDFGAALAPGRLGRWLWGRLLAWVDHQAVLKYLARHAPEELSKVEAQSLLRALRWRRLWFVSPHKDRGERAAARARIHKP